MNILRKLFKNKLPEASGLGRIDEKKSEVMSGEDARQINSFFIQVEIMIERPREQVWEIFLSTDEWKAWWGGGVKAADWREGGKLIWALGGGSPIIAFRSGHLVTIGGTFMDDTFIFEAMGVRKTLVRIGESTPRGGASFNDGGAARKAQLTNVLAKLKQIIEERT